MRVPGHQPVGCVRRLFCSHNYYITLINAPGSAFEISTSATTSARLRTVPFSMSAADLPS
mgnify:CR=1 FL=1